MFKIKIRGGKTIRARLDRTTSGATKKNRRRHEEKRTVPRKNKRAVGNSYKKDLTGDTRPFKKSFSRGGSERQVSRQRGRAEKMSGSWQDHDTFKSGNTGYKGSNQQPRSTISVYIGGGT